MSQSYTSMCVLINTCIGCLEFVFFFFFLIWVFWNLFITLLKLTFYFYAQFSGITRLAVRSQLCLWCEYRFEYLMFEVQHVPKNSSYLQMVAAEAKENISLMNKKSSSLLKYSIQSVFFFPLIFVYQMFVYQIYSLDCLRLCRMHLSTNVNSTLSKYSVVQK